MSELFKALDGLLILLFLLTLLFSFLFFVATSTAIMFNYHLHLRKSLFVGSEFRIRPNKDNPCWTVVSRKWTDRLNNDNILWWIFWGALDLFFFQWLLACWSSLLSCMWECWCSRLPWSWGRGEECGKWNHHNACCSSQDCLFFVCLFFIFLLLFF